MPGCAAVIIAGPNLTIDRTLRIAELRPGEVLRFSRVVVTPGGKGVNVARLARAFGADAVLGRLGSLRGGGRRGARGCARAGVQRLAAARRPGRRLRATGRGRAR